MSALKKMRKTYKLRGGIHPPENKTQSLQSPIDVLPVMGEIVLPLGMHIGAPAEAIVEVGQTVLKGEMIAKPKGFVSTAIHASTSGTVKAIEHRPIIHASGMTAPCIVIEPDGKDQWTTLTPILNYRQSEKNDLLEHINNSGIAGMGGAGFPSRVKLATDKTIEQLIINGTECEPYITADDILMQERAAEIVEGIEILQHLVNPQETLIGVEDNKPEAINALQAATQGKNIEVVVFPTKYPSGGEKQLIQILTGKEVKSGGLPADVGVVCQNIGSTYAIFRAVKHGEPLISRITTLTGEALTTKKNVEVRLGTSVQQLLDFAGFHASRANRVIAGGPMMGFSIPSLDAPVVKTTNCLLAPESNELPLPPEAQPCIRCGMCSEACPVSLLPQQLYWFAQAKDQEGLKKHHLMDCIECGACSYVCPSNIPLVQYYRASKADIRQTAEDQKKADYAKTRYEARLARIEKEEAEKEAKKQARLKKAAAATTAKEKSEVKAAVERTKAAPAEATDDPVAAAIARAKAKADASPLDKAKDNVASLEKRLKKAQAKLDAAKANNDENLAAFESSLTKLQDKLTTAKAELEKLQGEAPKATPEINTDDPVAAAIARAQASRADGESLSPEDKLNKDIESLTKRIKATETKVAAAKENGDEKAEILESSLTKMQDKLTTAQNELAKLQPAKEAPQAAPAVDENDPVAAAIARAQAKRSGDEALSPEDKLKKDIDGLNKRINATQEKVATAKENGDDKAEILESSLNKMQDKLKAAEAELAKLQPATEKTEDAAATQSHDPNDPVAAAIARAQAKREQSSDLSPEEKREKDIAHLEKRIKLTEEKLSEAKDAGDDKAEILESSLEKLKTKLADLAAAED
ncbi:MAG: electron transport complex subunit RsxC [Cellvibrionales bacterium]|nr:electron transport complex subunit RsxC [Cellvibrionales bacterium]